MTNWDFISTNMSLIDAKKLVKTYFSGGVPNPVIKGISFKIEDGEFVAITGPSGSGKSTLLHMIGFLDEPTEGQFCFDGKCMVDLTDDEVSYTRNFEMGFVFQAFNLLARTSVYDNVKLPLMYSKIPEKEWDKLIMDAINAVGLEHRTDYLSSQLSGGEKQRVAIARALVAKPKVIFADEPTGNLDSVTGKKVMEFLRKLNREDGHTVILITHDLSIAKTADRVIHILDGEIESDRRTKNSKSESRNPKQIRNSKSKKSKKK